MPRGRARPTTTSSTWGWQSASTRNRSPPARDNRRASVMASAAAVASSSMDALAISIPHRSATRVWKFSSISSRPWEISGW